MAFFPRMIRTVVALVLIVCGSFAHASADEAWRAYLAKDYARAFELAQTPALEGNKDAQYLLGLAAKHGRGAEQSHEVAVRWFTLAAERGHADALNDLATSYSRGEGVTRDDAKAFEYFRLAAERGSPAGQRNVGQMYEQGVGTAKDSLKALFWYERTDASLYARELRRKSKNRPAADVAPDKKLSDRCKPASPPVDAMNRARVDLLSGYIDFYIDERGKARGVTATDLNNEEFRYLVVAVFSKSLRTEDCRFGDGAVEISMRIPFKFVLTN
jgi:Sel1 repeat